MMGLETTSTVLHGAEYGAELRTSSMYGAELRTSSIREVT